MAIVKERYAAWREAAYFEIAEAARLLGDLPSAQIREPALHFLATRQTGIRWTVVDRVISRS